MGIAPYMVDIQGGRQVAAPTVNRVQNANRIIPPSTPNGVATSLYKGGKSVTKSSPPLQRGEIGIAAGGIAPEVFYP